MRTFRCMLALALFSALAPAYASIAPPTVIDPADFGSPTFQESFQTLDAGPSGHRWRDILKGGAATDPSAHSLEASTWYGFAGDGGPSPFKPDTYGGLAITATRQAQPAGRAWRSGVLTTKLTFSQLHGYFEVAAILPTCTKGAWPAFWLLPVSGGPWPKNGEIDAPETIGDGSTYWSTHSGIKAGNVTIGVAGEKPCKVGPHTYGVLWQADTIGYYLDRKLVAQTPTPADFTVPMYMLIDLNVGGGWPGNPDPSLRYVQMFTSRVSIWKAPD